MPKITMPKGQVQMVSLYNLSTTVQYKSKKAAPTTSDKGKNNKIIVVDKDGNKIPVKGITGMNIKFVGDNNYLEIHEPINGLRLDVNITSNVKIIIKGSKHKKRYIYIVKGQIHKGENTVYVGENLSCSKKVSLNLSRGGGDITIGQDCMFSWGIEIRTGDSHSVIDATTGKLLNPNQNTVIGNHVWIGMHSKILKGAHIPDGSVVGACSIVTKKFTEPNVVISGTPARITHHNTTWDRKSPQEILEEQAQ